MLALALVVAFVWLLGRATWAERAVGGLALASVLLCAVPVDWREPAYRDYRFAEYVAEGVFEPAAGDAGVFLDLVDGDRLFDVLVEEREGVAQAGIGDGEGGR